MRVANTRRSNCRRGATLVEFAIVCILCLMIFFGIFEFGRIVYVKQLMDNAAREGARFAVVHTNDMTTADIQSHVKRRLVGQGGRHDDVSDHGPLNATITVYRVNPATGANLGPWTNAGFGEAIAVQIDGTLRPLVPRLFFMPSSYSFRSVSVMYSEAN